MLRLVLLRLALLRLPRLLRCHCRSGCRSVSTAAAGAGGAASLQLLPNASCQPRQPQRARSGLQAGSGERGVWLCSCAQAPGACMEVPPPPGLPPCAVWLPGRPLSCFAAPQCTTACRHSAGGLSRRQYAHCPARGQVSAGACTALPTVETRQHTLLSRKAGRPLPPPPTCIIWSSALLAAAPRAPTSASCREEEAGEQPVRGSGSSSSSSKLAAAKKGGEAAEGWTMLRQPTSHAIGSTGACQLG